MPVATVQDVDSMETSRVLIPKASLNGEDLQKQISNFDLGLEDRTRQLLTHKHRTHNKTMSEARPDMQHRGTILIQNPQSKPVRAVENYLKQRKTLN